MYIYIYIYRIIYTYIYYIVHIFTLILHNVFTLLLAILFSKINYVDVKLTGGLNNEATVASVNVTDAKANTNNTLLHAQI